MPTVLMLLLGLGVSTLAVVRRARPCPPRPRPAHARRRALAVRRRLGDGDRHLVGPGDRHRRRAAGLRLRLPRPRHDRRLDGGADRQPRRSGRRQRLCRDARPGRLGAVALGIGAVGTHALALAPLGLCPESTGRSCRWSPPSPAPPAAACGARRVLSRRRPHQAGDARLAGDLGAGVRRQPGREQQLVLGAAGLGEQTGSLHAERLTSPTLVLFASVGSARSCWSACCSRCSRRACACRCGAPRPSCSGATSATA